MGPNMQGSIFWGGGGHVLVTEFQGGLFCANALRTLDLVHSLILPTNTTLPIWILVGLHSTAFSSWNKSYPGRPSAICHTAKPWSSSPLEVPDFGVEPMFLLIIGYTT